MKKEILGLVPIKPEILEISKIFSASEKRIQEALLSLSPEDFNMGEALKMKMVINAETKSLLHKTKTWVDKNIPYAYKLGKLKTESILKKKKFDNRNPAKGFKKHSTMIKKEKPFTLKYFSSAIYSIREFTDSYIYALKTAEKQLAKIQNFDVVEEINSIANEGLTVRELTTKLGFKYEGTLTRGQIQKQILDYLKTIVKSGNFITRGNMTFTLKNYAELTARTEMRRVQSEAVKNTCREYGNDLVQFSEHGSPCQICAPLEGEIYSISGNHPVYPSIDIDIPVHPRCEHNWNPYVEETSNG